VGGFVASVLKLLTNETLRRSMGRRGRKRAREHFDVNEMVDRYIRVYDSLR
jgi:glycosyltransferase involved in cell wall biosynthesis